MMMAPRSTNEPPGEPVPGEVVEQARSAFNVSRSGELAELVEDTLVDKHHPAGDHLLRFQHRSVKIQARVRAGEDGPTLGGEIRPRTAVVVESESYRQDQKIVAQACDGTFGFGPLGPGLIRLRISAPGLSALVRTDWFRI